MKWCRLILPVYIVMSSFTARSQENIIAVSVDNNVVVNARYGISGVRINHQGPQLSRVILSYGKSVIENGFIVIGMGFETFGIDMMGSLTNRFYHYSRRRILFPLGVRYAVPITGKVDISGQLGVQTGLFWGGTFHYIDTVNNEYVERSKGVFNVLTADMNVVIGVDIKLNPRNRISVFPNVIVNVTNSLKGGSQLKPTLVGLQLGYAHLF